MDFAEAFRDGKKAILSKFIILMEKYFFALALFKTILAQNELVQEFNRYLKLSLAQQTNISLTNRSRYCKNICVNSRPKIVYFPVPKLSSLRMQNSIEF